MDGCLCLWPVTVTLVNYKLKQQLVTTPFSPPPVKGGHRGSERPLSAGLWRGAFTGTSEAMGSSEHAGSLCGGLCGGGGRGAPHLVKVLFKLPT